MGRKRSPVQLVKRVIKISLHPERQRELINLIDTAPNKSRLVVNALEGRQPAQSPNIPEERDEMREQLADFLM